MLQERIAQVVKGYELREQIGVGGYGVVHRAYQPLVGRDVAVKIILPQYANHPDFIRRFEWEAQLVARLEHPYIVPLYDYWRDPDGAFLVMRWLRGGNLHDLLHNRPLPTELLGRLIEQVGGALASAHRRGVVHRDLKPANILLDEEGNAYLADFGIAKDLGTRISPYQTDASTVVGSPAYISPEQVRAEPITPQTDIYSLGVMLYEILTGQLPFHAPTPVALMFMHMNEPVPTVRTQRPDLSDAVNMVIQKATAKRPADRYSDVTTLMQELRQALASGPAITGRLTDALPTPSQPENDNRTTSGTSTRSKYETGVLYLPAPLVEPIETEIENPYKGLRAFQEADADDFFGRELLTQLLLARMQEQVPLGRFLAVVGPSGSGKSSVVRAGLVPAIRRGALPGSQNWFVIEMFPGTRPIEELAQALMHVAVEPPNNLIGPLTLDDQGLLRVVDQVVPGADETEVVLVIDQFEEVFTLVEDEAARTHFLNSLINAVTDPYSRIRVIVTLRADFYDRPLLYPGFSELMRQRTEVVVPLAPEELKQAIISPAERNGLRVDPELVEAIVNDVAEQPGALPLLQYALTEVFERRSGSTLTLTPYNASGGVLGSLARRAEELYTSLRDQEQEAARQLFLRLVTLGEGVEDTRRRVRRTELATMAKDEGRRTKGSSDTNLSSLAVRPSLDLDHVIATYSQYRLLTLDNDPATRVPTVEVAHEALIRTWTRLRQWLDASRDDLRLQRRMTMAAAEWVASGHDRSFLASGARLEQLAGWADETHLALNAEERDYLQASLAERDAQYAQEAIRKAHESTLEQRSRTFLRALVGVALVAALLGIGLSVYAFGQRQVALDKEKLAVQSADVAATAQVQALSEAERAKQQEAIAKQQETLAQTSFNEARDRALASGSQAALIQGNLDLALPLAMTIADKPDPLPFAESTLVDVVQSPGTRQVYPISGSAAQGHKGIINTVAFSPDGTRAVSGGRDDHILILWDLATGNELQRFVGHTLDVRQAVFLPGGKQILSSSTDGTLILWDIATGKALRTFKQHDGEVKGAALRPNSTQFMSVGLDTRVLLWDINCSQPTQTNCDTPIREFKGHTQEVNQVAFTSDGKRAITASQDGILILWDVEDGQLIRQIEPQEGRNELRGIAFLPDDRHVLAGGASGDMTEWDTETGQPVRVFKGHNRTLYDIAVSKDGKRALSGSADNTVILWDVQNGSIIHQFHGHGGYIREVAFNPRDESQAISCSADGTLRLWYLDSPVERRRLEGPGQIHAGLFSSDGRSVLTGAENGSGVGDLQLWDATTGELRFDKSYQERGVKAIAFSPDGNTILAGGDKHDGSLTLIDAKTGQFIRTFTAKTFGINALAFTPDGKRALSGSIIPPAEEVKANAALTNTMLMLWDVNTGAPIRQFQGLTDSVNGLTFLPGGTQVLVASGPNLGIWDIETGQRVRDFKKGHKSNINALALSADGKIAASGSRDKTFIVWNADTGERLWTSEAQDSEISGIAISKDGRYVLTAVENTVLMWDVRTQQQARRFLGHREVINDVAFSPDERSVVSVSADGTARIWRLDPLVDMVAWAKKNLYLPALTCDQKRTYKLDPINCT